MIKAKLFAALATLLVVASPGFAQYDFDQNDVRFEQRFGKVYGKLAAPEGTDAYERPDFFCNLNHPFQKSNDGEPWGILEIKAVVGESILPSARLANIAYRGDRLDLIRYEIGELGAFRSSTIDYDDAEYFAVDPISGTLSWKKLPPPGKYDFALVVKAFDAERPELFDEILVVFAISIKLTPPPAPEPETQLLSSVGDVPPLEPTDDAASPEAPQVASEPRYPEFYNDEKLAFYRDPRYAKPLPEGIFGMRTISVPEDGFHNDQDRELYVGLKGVADVLSQAEDYADLLQKLEPYSEAIFGKETTDNYGGPLYERFTGVYYQDYKRALTLYVGHPTLCDSLTVCHVDGYVEFRVNKDPHIMKSKAEEIELNGNWQTGEVVKVNVFYFDSRDAFEITFYPDGSPRRFRRCEFADAPTNFLGVPFRPGPNGKSRDKRFKEAMKSLFPTLVLYSTVWNKDGSVAERVDEPTDVAETIGTASLKVSNFLKKDEESVSNEAASEKTE